MKPYYIFLISVPFISCKTSEKSSVDIIGGADGPTGIYVTNNDDRTLTHRENGWYHVLSADSLSAKPIITVKDMAGLKLEKDYYGKYAISGRISKHKINKWADETEKAIGKQIAFVYNDSIVSDPQVNGRIESGTFMITSLSDKKLPEIYKGVMKEKSDSIEVIFADWEKDSLYYELSPEERDSVKMGIDYWEAKAWLDMSSKPDEHTAQEDDTVMSDDQKARKRIDKMIEKANRYRKSITDTTYLQTTVEMSNSAIDALNTDGYNDDYLYNQVVYLAALDRARKYLSEQGGKLICSLSSPEDINVRNDLYDFILDVFRQWNEMLGTGNFKIIKDEKGLLMIVHKDYGSK